MARKDVLIGLLATPAPAAAAGPPRAQKGAIGAVSRSIADLKARAVIETPRNAVWRRPGAIRLAARWADRAGGCRRMGPWPKAKAATTVPAICKMKSAAVWVSATARRANAITLTG